MLRQLSMSSGTMWSLIGVLLLVGVHSAAEWLHRGVLAVPAALSLVNGVALAYVVVDLLPEIAEAQEQWLDARADRSMQWLERQIYVAVLIGLLIALALDRAADKRSGRPLFWIGVITSAISSMLVGGVAVRLAGPWPVALMVLAFGAHFLITDLELARQDRRAFHRSARWILAGAVAFGFVVASLWQPSGLVIAALIGLLAGGTILETVKHEVRGAQGRRLGIFAIAAVAYAVLVLALQYSLYES